MLSSQASESVARCSWGMSVIPVGWPMLGTQMRSEQLICCLTPGAIMRRGEECSQDVLDPL